MKARVTVTLKTGILDPQGKAIEGALKSLGVDGVASVRQGKAFDIELAGAHKAMAEAALKDAADKLLAKTENKKNQVELLNKAMAPTDREIYELVLEASRGVDRLERFIDELLADGANIEQEAVIRLMHPRAVARGHSQTSA